MLLTRQHLAGLLEVELAHLGGEAFVMLAQQAAQYGGLVFEDDQGLCVVFGQQPIQAFNLFSSVA